MYLGYKERRMKWFKYSGFQMLNVSSLILIFLRCESIIKILGTVPSQNLNIFFFFMLKFLATMLYPFRLIYSHVFKKNFLFWNNPRLLRNCKRCRRCVQGSLVVPGLEPRCSTASHRLRPFELCPWPVHFSGYISSITINHL